MEKGAKDAFFLNLMEERAWWIGQWGAKVWEELQRVGPPSIEELGALELSRKN